MRLSVACADIGSISAGRFGWAIRDTPGELRARVDQSSIRALARTVVRRLSEGVPVALGFECPLFVPLREDPESLTRGRNGDGNRPWSAGAGCGALATGLVETAWVLDRIRRDVTEEPQVFLSWPEFIAYDGCGLFLWEAFVTGQAKSGTHHGDAARAVEAFCQALPRPDTINLVSEPSVLSLVGAALLGTGWSVEVSVLRQDCLVVAG